MKVRSILFESSSLYLRHWFRLVPPALVLTLGVAVATLPLGRRRELAMLFLTPVLVFLLQALHVVESADARAGLPAEGFAATFARVRPRLRPLLGAIGLVIAKLLVLVIAAIVCLRTAVQDGSVAEAIGVLIAFFLLYMYLATRWAMVTPVILLEDLGAWRSFKRSKQLVHGHALRVFLVLLAAQVAVVVGSFLVDLGIEKGAGGSQFLREVISEPLTSPFLVLMWTNAYFALRSALGEPVVMRHPVPATAG